MPRHIAALELLLLITTAAAEPTLHRPGTTTDFVARDVEVREALAQDPAVVILDVRTPAEYASGHIPGALNIDVDDDSFAARIAELDRSTRYLVHCSANVPEGRSARAMSTMTKLGFERLGNLVGGYAAWTAADGPVVGDED
ncbi:MAG: rhodanese-like domain-containing protein [Pseudomonadales bacterium]|jgi:rhodanese-related sulfurtransferase|nr:rhodanese-like domain-containing protein [Pseudomonadales bacterium]